MSFRSWVTIITVILLGLVVYFGWSEIVKAWGLIDDINLWILALLIPVQFFSYYATGGMIFSYLRSKGDLKTTSHWQTTRMALELNFVNHILPSGGAAGFSYLGWVLHHHGVSAARSTMSQIVRFVLTFVSFILILTVAVIALILDHQIDRTIIIISAVLVIAAVIGTFLSIYIISNKRRLERFSSWLTLTVNKVVAKVTRGKKPAVINGKTLDTFFQELHQDYLGILKDKKILIKPMIWAILANLSDVVLISIAFLALGYWVNPATLFVAFGIASISGVFAFTPGGAGVYEAIMIAFLVSAGVPPDIAIAGTLLALSLIHI
jgi:uncharacterized protein (TIRG00374 family)